ncbi:cytochrome P450 [Streptomyces sp. NPDC088251]|uniref:cytochrome P450 n=1 Tax=unclassified Streptomyces TaxID=2593676 RepID=UPI0037F859E0
MEGAARHGDFWEYRPNVFVVAGGTLARHILVRTGKEFLPPRGVFPLPEHVRRAFTSHTLLPDDLKAARRAFSHNGVSQSTGVLACEAATLAKEWETGRAVEVMPAMRRAMSRMGAQFCYGADASGMTHAELRLAHLRDTAHPRTTYLPPQILTPTRLRLRRGLHDLVRRIDDVIERREGGMAPAAADASDVLSAMIASARQHGTPPGRNIPHILAPLHVAAQEMPTRAAAWMLLCLAEHPGAADRVADEASALPADPGQITATHAARMRFTDAFVRETLRMYPPNWLAERVVTVPVHLAGHQLAPGTRVLVSPYLLHRNPRYHRDPSRFRPERWLERERPGATDAYLPYGAGPRLCPGAALATLELTLVLALTARHLHVSTPHATPYRLTSLGALTPQDLRLVYRRREGNLLC